MSELRYKVSLVGQSGVGKTSILTRYVEGVYTPIVTPTIGANFLTKQLNVNNQKVYLNIWDTAGQEMYRSLTPMYYRNASAAIIVFDVTCESTFNAIKDWVCELRTNEPDILIFICGNKIDCENRVIETSRLQQLALSLNIPYTESSASTGQGIDQLFQMVVLEVMKKESPRFHKEIQPTIVDAAKTQESVCC